MFGTHQGVKGLQFDRVLAILDDDEARGFCSVMKNCLELKRLAIPIKKI